MKPDIIVDGQIDGRRIALNIMSQLGPRVDAIVAKGGNVNVAFVGAGKNGGVEAYKNQVEQFFGLAGISYVPHIYSDNVDITTLADLIGELNSDDSISGIMYYLPLPGDLKLEDLLPLMDSRKDLDGFKNPEAHIGRNQPCTALAVSEVFKGLNIQLSGLNVAVVGQGRVAGYPITRILEYAGARVIPCDEETSDIPTITRNADVFVAAIGSPGFFTEEYIPLDGIVIDVGINVQDGKLVGDVDPSAYSRARLYTPVPGGIGPLTTAMLARNAVTAAERALSFQQV